MKTKTLTIAALAVGFAFGGLGCNRQTRANPENNRAATPEEGGATLNVGSAGDRKDFGDTHAKQQHDGMSPSASPTGQSKDVKPGQSGGAINPPDSKTGTK